MEKSQRVMRARLGGLTTAALGHVNTAPARQAFFDRFLDEVDPARALGTAEREKRAAAAFRAHMTRLSLHSSIARARKRAS